MKCFNLRNSIILRMFNIFSLRETVKKALFLASTLRCQAVDLNLWADECYHVFSVYFSKEWINRLNLVYSTKSFGGKHSKSKTYSFRDVRKSASTDPCHCLMYDRSAFLVGRYLNLTYSECSYSNVINNMITNNIGCGGILNLYDLNTNEFLESLDVFRGSRIHGIRYSTSHRKLVVFGGKLVAIVIFEEQENPHR